MATTMREVAEAAGVSIATVSFVVNNSKRVAPETRERIERVMTELGFRRNIVARALASRRTQIIALVYPVLEHRLSGSITEFITSAARAASAAEYHLVVWPVGNDGSELAALVGQKLVDGVLLMEVQLDDARVAALLELDIPFALIGRTRDVTGLHYVDIDFDASVQMAMDHLATLGHHQIVLVNGSQEGESFASYGPYVRSEIAYRELCAQREIEPVVLVCRQTVRSGREAAMELVATAPVTTAVIIADEVAAAGLVAELTRIGREVPSDISVMSILSSLDMAAICNPPLTTVTAPGTELGRLGVEALLRQLDGGPPMTPVLRAGVLAIGESTGPIRGIPRDPMINHQLLRGKDVHDSNQPALRRARSDSQPAAQQLSGQPMQARSPVGCGRTDGGSTGKRASQAAGTACTRQATSTTWSSPQVAVPATTSTTCPSWTATSTSGWKQSAGRSPIRR
jgi:DNA-binding LacI/PurR family transcriptional regulator